jgi:hypothetical protein
MGMGFLSYQSTQYSQQTKPRDCRLIARINYEKSKVYVLRIMTHKEYDLLYSNHHCRIFSSCDACVAATEDHTIAVV